MPPAVGRWSPLDRSRRPDRFCCVRSLGGYPTEPTVRAATKASKLPLYVVSYAPAVDGKSVEKVSPLT
jgi:hypothetical protein